MAEHPEQARRQKIAKLNADFVNAAATPDARAAAMTLLVDFYNAQKGAKLGEYFDQAAQKRAQQSNGVLKYLPENHVLEARRAFREACDRLSQENGIGAEIVRLAAQPRNEMLRNDLG